MDDFGKANTLQSLVARTCMEGQWGVRVVKSESCCSTIELHPRPKVPLGGTET
jgi:hypothetical protein